MGVHIPRSTAREVPPDFREFAPTHSLTEIRNHYKCGISTVQRWCSVCKVEYRRRNVPAKTKENRVEPHDCRAVINTCLTCDEPVCQGNCERVRDAREAYYKENAMPGYGVPSRYTTDQRHYVAHLYRAGYTKRSIARFTGVKYATIENWLDGVRQYQKPPRLPNLESKRQEWEGLCGHSHKGVFT